MSAPSAESAPVYVRRDARNGIVWLKAAFAMFRAAALPWLLLALSYYLILALLELGPWAVLGQFVAPVLKPVFAVGFLAAAWTQERGGAPRVTLLFNGFRSNLYALVPIGMVFLGGIAVAVLATTLVDGGTLIAVMSGAQKATPELVMGGRLQLAMFVGLLAALPTLLALWFAPALVVFDDLGALRALGTSLSAALANWRALLVYGLVVFVLGGILPAFALTILQLISPAIAGTLALFVVVPYAMALVATLQISDYVCYRDVFHSGEPLPAPGTPRPSGP